MQMMSSIFMDEFKVGLLLISPTVSVAPQKPCLLARELRDRMNDHAGVRFLSYPPECLRPWNPHDPTQDVGELPRALAGNHLPGFAVPVLDQRLTLHCPQEGITIDSCCPDIVCRDRCHSKQFIDSPARIRTGNDPPSGSVPRLNQRGEKLIRVVEECVGSGTDCPAIACLDHCY